MIGAFGAFGAIGLLLGYGPRLPDQNRQRRLILIGDSTMADYEAKHAPLTGWGQALRDRLDSRQILNRARPGSSSRSFMAQHWSAVRAELRQGDLLVMQFGHIDALPDPSRHTEPNDGFQRCLNQFVSDTKRCGAIPVLCTPVATHNFVEHQLWVDQHLRYAAAMDDLARREGLALIELGRLSGAALQVLGAPAARAWFMMAVDGHDTVHLNGVGASAVAKMVEAELNRLQLI